MDSGHDAPEDAFGSPRRSGEITRRQALQMMSGVAVVAAVGSRNGFAPQLTSWRTAAIRRAPAQLLGPGPARSVLTPAPDFTAVATRAEDMLLLGFDFYNMSLDTTSTPARMVVVNTAQPAYMVVVFPPQHVGEEAVSYPDPPPAGWPSDPPYPGILTDQSWLAFQVPGPIDFTLPSLLTWTALTPNLVPVAVPKKGTKPAQPTAMQTSIEVPWNLVLSPDAKGTWHHSATPVTHGSITELWQTRLGQGTSEPPAVTPNVRAVWTPGYPANPVQNPFLMSLQPNDRTDIVTLSSGGQSVTGLPVPSVPVPAELFMLTALGASVDLNGVWNEPSASSLLRWVQRNATGRESYVKTVRSGFVFPTGHKAVRTVITDREILGRLQRRRGGQPDPAHLREHCAADRQVQGKRRRAPRGSPEPASLH